MSKNELQLFLHPICINMKLKIQIILLLIFFLINASGISQELKQAPLNPDYIKFIEEYSSADTDPGSLMAAPSPYKVNFKEYFKQKKITGTDLYPIAYDMRTAGPGGTSLLTSVKHQLSCGACWAFATCSSIESSWKIMGLGDNDLSENNMKNCHGFEYGPCAWGHHFMSTAYLLRGSGPIAEYDDPYDPVNYACVEGLIPEAYIPTARYLPEDHDVFKETIMTEGAVYNTFRSESSGYQWINGNYTYCYQGPASTTHAIAIVGWNDTLSTACGQGAWLCKNQYGTSFGDNGFFYISYQDTLVLKYNAIWSEREDYDPEMKIYQYDTIGGWPFLGYSNPVIYGLIKYVAVGDQFVSRIGTYTVSFGSYLSAEIYSDFDGFNLTNLLATIPEQYCDNPGFWQLNLPESIRINNGKEFYIKVKYYSPGELYPLAVEGAEDDYSNPHIETGKCWTSPDGNIWDPAGIGTGSLFDLCIKTYAYNVTKLNVKVILEGPFNGGYMNTDINGVLPFTQPYNTSPWNYAGTENVVAISNANIVDWVLVELRETAGSASMAVDSTIIAQQAAFLLNDGTVVGLDGFSKLVFDVHVRDNLYIVIHHRNHLSVLSASSLTVNGSIYQYDFSDASAKAFNSGHKHLGGSVYGMIGGDGIANGTIDMEDKSTLWKLQAGEGGYKEGDYNLDKQVANPDKNKIWKPNLNSNTQVPE